MPREAPQGGGDEDQDHRVEEVDGEAVVGHEPGKPPAGVETLPEYDDDAEAGPHAEEGLPEGVGGALPMQAAIDHRYLAISPDPEEEEGEPEGGPADEGGLQPADPEGIGDPLKPAPPAGGDPHGEEGDVGGEEGELHVQDVGPDRLDEADREGGGRDDEDEFDDVPVAGELRLLHALLFGISPKEPRRGVGCGEDEEGDGKPHRPRAAEELEAEEVSEVKPSRSRCRIWSREAHHVVFCNISFKSYNMPYL